MRRIVLRVDNSLDYIRMREPFVCEATNVSHATWETAKRCHFTSDAINLVYTRKSEY